MKYRHKPVIVEAEQFLRHTPWPEGVREITVGKLAPAFQFLGGTGVMGSIATITEIRVGDWVVTNPDGARHVVTMFDFFDFYEIVTEREIADG